MQSSAKALVYPPLCLSQLLSNDRKKIEFDLNLASQSVKWWPRTRELYAEVTSPVYNASMDQPAFSLGPLSQKQDRFEGMRVLPASARLTHYYGLNHHWQALVDSHSLKEPAMSDGDASEFYALLLYLVDAGSFVTGPVRVNRDYGAGLNAERTRGLEKVRDLIKKQGAPFTPYIDGTQREGYDGFRAEPLWQDAVVSLCSSSRTEIAGLALDATSPSDNDWNKITQASIQLHFCHCSAEDDDGKVHEAFIDFVQGI